MDDKELLNNKYYRAYKSIPRLQKAIDNGREVNHKLYEYSQNLERSFKYIVNDYRKIKELMKTVLIVGGQPVKNTRRKDCYEVLEKIQEIVGSNR